MAGCKAKWAQDHRRVFISVSITGVGSTQDIDLAPDGTVTVRSPEQAFHVQLFGGIVPDHPDTKVNIKPNSVEITVRKDEKGYWPGLLHGGAKDRAITVDWDKWVDEDECEDDDHEHDEPDQSAFPPSAMAQEAESPLDGDCGDRFSELNPNEKMLAFTHAWNKCVEEERAQLMNVLKKILDDSEAADLNSEDLKGAGLLEPRDISSFPSDVHLPHIDPWLVTFAGSCSEEKMNFFTKWWGWCDDEEKRLVMPGLSR